MTEIIHDPGLAALDGVAHGFFSRTGGVSEGLFASLNTGFGSGDDPAHVAENRARATAALGLAPERLTTAYQVHSAQVETVTAPIAADAAPHADGFATATRGIALGILTADCAPVLFCDPGARVIGAAHAGWRGALSGVLEATMRAMEALGARRAATIAAIGPCIGKDSYEVGAEFPAPFIADDPAARACFAAATRSGHHMFDLEGYVAGRLRAMNLAAVNASGLDTCALETRFFSFRRATLRGEPGYGRGLSAIALEG
jgi:YfiH family protein